MKIVFIIGTMYSGGAERVVSEMSNYWVKQGWDITILTIGAKKGEKDFYTLDSRIKRVDISLAPSKSKVGTYLILLRLLWRIRRFVSKEKLDAVISFISDTNILVLLALLGIKVSKIISDRADPYRDRVGFFTKKLIYPLADNLVIQTYSVKKFYKDIPNLKVTVIPNPITPPTISTKTNKFQFKNKTIVAVGSIRLEKKGFDLLVKAFAKISKKYSDWDLVIFGDGSDRLILENLILEYGLKDRVFLPGVVDNPREIIVDADIFVLSSIKEGFPNVLIEAMSVGLACVSFDCNFGPSEIIDNYKNGILVETGNIEKLQEAIEKLINSKSLREELGNRAKKDIMDRYYIDKIMKEWERQLL